MFKRDRADRDDRRGFFSYQSGRGGRTEFWGATIGILVFGGLFYRVAGSHGSTTLLVSLCVTLRTFCGRRLHDFGQSAWWTALVPAAMLVLALAIGRMPGSLGVVILVGILTGFVFFAFIGLMPGDPERNRFGPPVRRPGSQRGADNQPA